MNPKKNFVNSAFPTIIKVVEAYFPDLDGDLGSAFTKDGEPIFSITAANARITEDIFEFDDELFNEIMAIHDESSAKAFLKRNRDSYFYLQNLPLSACHCKSNNGLYKLNSSDGMVSVSDYIRFVCGSVQQVKDIMQIKSLTKDAKLSDADKRQKLIDMYNECMGSIEESFRLNRQYEAPATGINAYIEATKSTQQLNYRALNKRVAYRQNKREPFADYDEFELRKNMSDGEFYYHMLHECAERHDIDDFIIHMMSTIDTSFNPEIGAIELICPSLLVALYVRCFIDFHHGREYRKCAHPKCDAYFLVDQSHPQTRCPKHMETRQRKRLNYYNNYKINAFR